MIRTFANSLHVLIAAISLGFFLTSCSPAVDGATPQPAERTISFAKGKWNPQDFRPVRMANQETPREFTQSADFIGVTKESFRKDDYDKERDNAVILTDTGTTEGEIEVAFRLGKGFNGYSAPGILISPVVKDDVVEKAIAVFVGDYAVAVWPVESDREKKLVTYAHLAQLARRTDPERRHVLRCRWSKEQKSVAIQVDDSDVMAFQFIGNKTLSKVDMELNSQVCLVGCHGVCEFYEMKIRNGGTLPFIAQRTAERQ